MKPLHELTDNELAVEVERRRALKAKLPQPLVDYKMDKIEDICNGYIRREVEKLPHDEESFNNYLFEDLMRTIYGPQIFEIIKKLRREKI